MAFCPNCNQKLRLTDVSQTCPHCGVNMRFFGYDERFYHDAKEAELSNARVHVFIRKMKAALIGSRLAVVRLVMAFLPAASLLTPVARAGVTFPFMSASSDFGILGLADGFQHGILHSFPALLSSVAEHSVIMLFAWALGCFLLAALCAAAMLLTTLLNFINMKRAARANCVFALFGAAAVAVCAVLSVLIGSRAAFTGCVVDCAISFGWVIQIPVYLAFFIVNRTVLKDGLPVELDEGMAERVEISKKVRRGELRLEDLPQPVVETAETRKIQEEIEKAREEFREKKQKKEAAADA